LGLLEKDINDAYEQMADPVVIQDWLTRATQTPKVKTTKKWRIRRNSSSFTGAGAV
jgi:hypothetical protein